MPATHRHVYKKGEGTKKIPLTSAEAKQIEDKWAVEDALAPAREKQRKIREIKEAAYKDIVARWPEWKQRNMIAHAIENLVAQLEAQGIEIDKTAAQETLAAWEWIKQRRKQSDEEEAAL